MNVFSRILLLPLAALCLSPATVQAQGDETTVAALAIDAGRCDRVESLSNLQRKIVDKASQGATPLFRFIHGTRMMYQLDAYETVAWLDKRRAALASCGIAVAANPVVE
jgi:hypothetical protein